MPTLSILVVAYRMPYQALKTVHTLLPPYQRGVSASDVEVVLVENSSDRPIPVTPLRELGPAVTHVYRSEPGCSPVAALNLAYAASSGDYLGIIIDGARMVTPGLMRNVLDVFAMQPDALVTPLGFHLGARNQQDMDHTDHNGDIERRLLAGLPYRGDGYDLFRISCLSVANPHGCQHPMMESSALFVSRERYQAIGLADPRFDLSGGGMVNLDIYRRLCELPGASLWVLPGEGSFHQFHGGVTTRSDDERADLMARFQAQYRSIRGCDFRSPTLEPQLYGEIPDQALELLRWSAIRGMDRFVQRTMLQDSVWADEVTVPRQALALLQGYAAEHGIKPHWRPTLPAGSLGDRPSASTPTVTAEEAPVRSPSRVGVRDGLRVVEDARRGDSDRLLR